MRKLSRKLLKSFFTLMVVYMPLVTALQRAASHAAEPSHAGTARESEYQELEKDERPYVFASSAWLADFEKTGELGKAVIKVGYGPGGETVVFDSDEALKEYDNRHSKK